MRIAATILALALLLLLGASAQQLPPPEIAASEASIHSYGDRDTTCAEWTDGCRTCVKPEGGDPTCPNIGPACQPKAITCSRRTGAAK
jgi:hypothetical protein